MSVESVPDERPLAVRERDAARATIDSIMEAIKGDRFTDGLQTAEWYVRYTLGTAGHLYHVEGYMDLCRERDVARAQAEALAEALREISHVEFRSTQDMHDFANEALRAFREAPASTAHETVPLRPREESA